jgi:hypothetical protein
MLILEKAQTAEPIVVSSIFSVSVTSAILQCDSLQLIVKKMIGNLKKYIEIDCGNIGSDDQDGRADGEDCHRSCDAWRCCRSVRINPSR